MTTEGYTPEQVSVENIKVQAEALQLKLKAAQKDREELINKKVSDREMLVDQSKQMYTDLAQAESMLANTQSAIESATKAGVEASGEDRKSFEGLTGLVEGLRQQAETVEKQIAALSGQPEIQSKLEDQAGEEEKTKEVKRIEARAKAELALDVEKLKEASETLMTEDQKEFDRIRNLELREKVGKAQEAFRAIFDRSFDTLDSKIGKMIQEGKSTEEIEKLLSAEKDKLGFLFYLKKKKEKKPRLSKLHLIDQIRVAQKEQKDANDHYESADWKPWKAFAEQYRKVIEKAQKYEDEIDRLTGSRRNNYQRDILREMVLGNREVKIPYQKVKRFDALKDELGVSY